MKINEKQKTGETFTKNRHYRLYFSIFNLAEAQQQLIELSGIIKNTGTRKGLDSVKVQIENTEDTSFTDPLGNFKIRTRVTIPFRLVINKDGYTPQTVEVLSPSSKISVGLNPQNTIIDAVVISASRTPEKILRSPIAIEKIDIRTIRKARPLPFMKPSKT